MDERRVEADDRRAKKLEELDKRRVEADDRRARELEKLAERRVEDSGILAKELEKIEERFERRRKEDQARSRWFAGFLILLTAAMITVVGNFSSIASFFASLR